MDRVIFGFVVGFLLMLFASLALRRRGRKGGARIRTGSSVDAFRSVGELVVLKVFTKQIVTSRDHLLGDWGEKWLNWLLSTKQTAMVFEFLVDFRYDLRDPAFGVQAQGDGSLGFTLPPVSYEIQLKDIELYDERGAALVPVLLPEWIGRVFGGKFSEKEKNQLIRAAREEAEGLAKQLVTGMRHEVQKSAEATLASMARGIGYESTSFLFADTEPLRLGIDLSRIEASASRALQGED